MIVTEAQINRLHRGGRVELDVDFRPTVGETYAAQLEKGLKRALDVSVVGAVKLGPGQWRVLVVKGSRVEKPLLLKARPGTDDYTERSGLAMPDEPEPIDPKARDAYAERARQAADEKRKAQRGAPGDLQIHIDAARRAERALFEELDERYVDWTPHQIAEQPGCGDGPGGFLMPDLDVILNRLRGEALYVSLDASRPMEIQFSLANGPGGFIPLADAESAVREARDATVREIVELLGDAEPPNPHEILHPAWAGSEHVAWDDGWDAAADFIARRFPNGGTHDG